MEQPEILQRFIELGAYVVVLVPVVTGLVEIVKRTNVVQERFLPLVSLIVGVLLGFLVLGVSVIGGLIGITLGLAGTGLWEFGKTTLKGQA